METVRGYLTLFGSLIALIAVGEIPVVHALSDWINENRSWLLPFTLGTAGAGLLAMIWGWTMVAIRYGRPMSDEEAKQFMAQPIAASGKQSFAKGRFKGLARGRKLDQPVEWSFREMKAAWHSGIWWREPDMRRKYLITAGGLLLILGGFSVFLVLMNPPAAKLLMAGTLVYVIARTVLSFRRA